MFREFGAMMKDAFNSKVAPKSRANTRAEEWKQEDALGQTAALAHSAATNAMTTDHATVDGSNSIKSGADGEDCFVSRHLLDRPDSIGAPLLVSHENSFAFRHLLARPNSTVQHRDHASVHGAVITTIDPIEEDCFTFRHLLSRPNSSNTPPDLEASAGFRLFRITELLEQILLHLSPIDILRIRQAAHKFNAIIMKNKDIRRIIFLERDNQQAVEKAVPLNLPPPSPRQCGNGRTFGGMTPRFSFVRRNPFVFRQDHKYLSAHTMPIRPKFASYILDGSGESSFPAIDDMYITNPPVERVFFTLGLKRHRAPPIVGSCQYARPTHGRGPMKNCIVEKVGGVKVRDLLKGIQDGLKELGAGEKDKSALSHLLIRLGAHHKAVADDMDE
ncbi:unnamed protein product [Zymoseptoria tritici ST99CH_3D7]|uniref:F-box domain-containing protein n=1 Tax=Zymoseptoria tritici (strain ST99CH_3D7) TaxID=1276538 RepID=A0A1X7RZG6_ZYMT9|nr:unnamed protein product [Zymoseptoria tritici ST99CH_3D7]